MAIFNSKLLVYRRVFIVVSTGAIYYGYWKKNHTITKKFSQKHVAANVAISDILPTIYIVNMVVN